MLFPLVRPTIKEVYGGCSKSNLRVLDPRTFHSLTMEASNSGARDNFDLSLKHCKVIMNNCKYARALLYRIYQNICSDGKIPDILKTDIISFLFKNKGDRSDPDNYRNITLLSCISKIFTSCLHQRIMYFLDSNSLLGEEQP